MPVLEEYKAKLERELIKQKGLLKQADKDKKEYAKQC